MMFKPMDALYGLEAFDPVGATIHYLASRDVAATVPHLVKENLAYHVIIDRDGTAWQMADFKKRVNHAGIASWHGYSPNRTHIAIALASFGELKFERKILKSWSGHTVKPEDAAYRAGNLGLHQSWWDQATDAQVETLFLVLKFFNFKPENVCGHDECALPHGRKADPGGVLPFKMSELRAILKAQVQTA